ncbi:MAG TPA: MFS transporter [Candidatus Limnocylindrales bacterium]|nr:MFS transporter [Candidatus Limnocylindrales bacterium]
MALLAAYRRLLGNGALARLLVGEFVSSIGDWLYLVALLIVVYEQADSPVLLGIVGAARVLPYVFLSLPAGIIADRFDRRLVLLVTDVARGVVMLFLAALVATGGPLVVIVALTIVAACFSAFFSPAIGAYLPSLVRDESELGPANSAWASLDNLAFIIGPAVGGLIIAAGGLTVAFLLNAFTFAIIAAVLWRLPSKRRMEAARAATEGAAATVDAAATSATDGPAEAPATMRQLVRPLLGIGLVNVVAGFVFGGLGILTVVIAVDVLQGGDTATGFLNAAIGIGGLIGALGSGVLVLRRRLEPPLVAGAVTLGIGLVALGATGSLLPAMVAMTIASAGSLVVEVVVTTLFQRAVPDAIRGRTLGALETIAVTAYAAGALLMPIIADMVGIGPTLAGGGIAVALAGGVGAVLMGRAAAPPPLDAARERFLRLPIFSVVPASRLEAAARQLLEVPVIAGQVVIRQGDPADRFYAIVTGRFEVTQEDRPGQPSRHLRTMSPDQVFGEIGLLARAPRTATVTALEDGLLLALDGPAFLDLVSGGAGLTSRLLDLHRGASTGAS